MNRTMKRSVFAGIAVLTISAASVVAADEPVTIKVVGDWNTVTNYVKHEEPFWNQRIGKVTNGNIKGEIKPLTELGLKGFEIMRLMKQGVFDYAYGAFGYVAGENAVFEGVDLTSIAPDLKLQRAVADAYFPTLEKAFAQMYDAKLMQIYPYPSQMLFCTKEIKSLDDLKGKKVRTWSTTLGDFIQAVGGVPVTVPLAEALTALETGVVDCGITATTTVYLAKWHQVAKYAYTMRLSWAVSFAAMSMKKWNSLSPNQQKVLLEQIKKLTDEMWEENGKEDAIALSCLAGRECSMGKPASMTLHGPTTEDMAKRDKIATDVVLSRWAKRCGTECVGNWNSTVGKLVGLTAAAK